jgi:nitrilase
VTIVVAAVIQISTVLYLRGGAVQKVVQKIVQLGKFGIQFAISPKVRDR